MSQGELKCIIEIPKGTRKDSQPDYEFDPVKPDRRPISVAYPTDYGFFPETRALNGGPLSAMVCLSEPTFPGCVIPVRPQALFKAIGDNGYDEKVLCVPHPDATWQPIKRLPDLPSGLPQEMECFFSTREQADGMHVHVFGWSSPAQPWDAIDAATARYVNEPDGRG